MVTPTKFKMDTGADVTVIPNTVLRKLHQVKLSPPDRQLLGPNNQRLTVKGCFKGNLKSKTSSTSQHIYVVPGLHMPLLGRPAVESLGLVQRIESISSNSDLMYTCAVSFAI